LVEDTATVRELPSGHSSCAVAATFFAAREAAGWGERDTQDAATAARGLPRSRMQAA
jgi:hypothetical protein